MSDIGHTNPGAIGQSGRGSGDGADLSRERREVTSNIFTLLFEMGDALKDRIHVAANRRDLGMAHVALLHALRTPCRMGELARELGYDASHITAVVDRLEERGLVVRSSDPSDRRVRLIARTDEGTAVSDEIQHEMVDADEVFVRLSIADCRKIRDLLQKGLDRYRDSTGSDSGEAEVDAS